MTSLVRCIDYCSPSVALFSAPLLLNTPRLQLETVIFPSQLTAGQAQYPDVANAMHQKLRILAVVNITSHRLKARGSNRLIARRRRPIVSKHAKLPIIQLSTTHLLVAIRSDQCNELLPSHTPHRCVHASIAVSVMEKPKGSAFIQGKS